ncbi:MAG TPA: MurR/RpiR family transcriptional regulator [Candidatus Binatia bacterium]|jgi:DNA-binding MurR/RpiR family transcriptional regulator
MLAIDKIQNTLGSMSNGQRLLGEYLLNDSAILLVSTAKEVADAVGVSESTVIRFAKELGYRGFPDLKRQLRKEIGPRLSASARMQKTFTGIAKSERLVAKLIERDIELLRATIDSISDDVFEQAVRLILKARRVFVVGFSSSFALASFIQFRLTRLGKDVHWLFVTGGTSLAEQLAQLRKGDLMIAIGFLRAPRETETAMDHAKRVGALVLGITDFVTNPIAKQSNVCLFAHRGLHVTVNSMTAPFSLVNALMLAVAGAQKQESLRALKNLDQLLENYPV